MCPDPLSSTDGAGRIVDRAIDIAGQRDRYWAELRAWRERTRVLEEALGFYANEKYDHGDRAHAALAAVAVEATGRRRTMTTRPDPDKPFAQVRAGELRLTTHLEGGRSVEDATIRAENIDGFLHIEIDAPEDRIVGYAVSVNGRPVPRDDA